jgi:class 3 adenylate cyclase
MFTGSLLILLALVTGLGFAGLPWWRRILPGAAPGAGTPGGCGKCGYDVTGLPTFTCPECGSDLREVGIVRRPGGAADGPARPRRAALTLLAALLAWTLAYAVLYAAVGARSYPVNPWDSAGPRVWYGLVDAHLWPYRGKSTHAVTLTPRSGAYSRVTVTEQREARFKGWRNAPVVNWTGDSPATGLTRFDVTLQLDKLDGKTATMELNPRTLAWQYPDPDPTNPGQTCSGPGPIDADEMLRWMVTNGVDQPSPAIREESEALVDLVRRSGSSGTVGGAAWATGRLERIAAAQRDAAPYGGSAYVFTATRGTAQDSYGPGWSIYWLSIPFGLGLYTYGANWIITRHRRRTRPAGGGATAGAGMPADEHAPPSAAAARRDATRGSRTLTILFTDLKDYTARSASASRETLRAMLHKNKDIVEPSASRHGGSVIKTIGDAYLLTFESATDAVLCGMEMQRAAAAYNATVAHEQQLEYRIAVCTGEVTLDDGDVFGTPVNVAARVQALAEPGDVYFTESTLHAINAAEVRHEELGSRELKGVPLPVRVYRAFKK